MARDQATTMDAICYRIEPTPFGEVHHHVSDGGHIRSLYGCFPHPGGAGRHTTIERLTDAEYQAIQDGSFDRIAFEGRLHVEKAGDEMAIAEEPSPPPSPGAGSPTAMYRGWEPLPGEGERSHVSRLHGSA